MCLIGVLGVLVVVCGWKLYYFLFWDVCVFLMGIFIGCLLYSVWNLVVCNLLLVVELKFISVGCKWRKFGRVNVENC